CGAGFSGTTARTAGTRGTGTVLSPSANNPFKGTFANPLYSGLGTAVTSTTGARAPGGLASPLYAITTAAAATTGVASATGPSFLGFTTIGMRKVTPYATGLSEELPFTRVGVVTSPNLQQIIDRTSALKGRKNITVGVDGNVVVLRGEVSSERERRLAEGILRLEPGVTEIRNELVVTGPTLPPLPIGGG